jgi:hypothetical protein
MAKTIGPLMSTSASGTLHNAITFTKGNVAHIPNNPGAQRTAQRGNDRQIFRAISQALTRCAPSVRAEIRTLIDPDPHWRAALTDRLSGAHHATWDAVAADWFDQLSTVRDEWQAIALAAGFDQVSLPYASDPAIDAGLQMWQLAATLYAIGLNISSGPPDASNAQAWADYITDTISGPPANALTLDGQVLTLNGVTLTITSAGNFGTLASIAGALANRPAPDATQIGRFYFATDTGRLYRDSGTSWLLVSLGTP